MKENKQSVETSVALIQQSIETMCKSIGNIETHMAEQNGKVFKNTAFRLKALGAFALLSFFGATTLIGVVVLFINAFK